MKIFLQLILIIVTGSFSTVKGAQYNGQFYVEQSAQTHSQEEVTINFEAHLSILNARVIHEKMSLGLVTDFVAYANKLNQIGDRNFRNKLQESVIDTLTSMCSAYLNRVIIEGMSPESVDKLIYFHNALEELSNKNVQSQLCGNIECFVLRDSNTNAKEYRRLCKAITGW